MSLESLESQPQTLMRRRIHVICECTKLLESQPQTLKPKTRIQNLTYTDGGAGGRKDAIVFSFYFRTALHPKVNKVNKLNLKL